MKSFKIIISVIAFCFLVAAAFLTKAIIDNKSLQVEKAEKEEKIMEAKRAQRRLGEFQQEIERVKEETARLEARIFKDKKMPTRLITELSRLGNQMGLRKIEFVYKTDKDEEPSPIEAIAVQAIGSQSSVVEPLLIEMNCEGQFVPLLSFLKNLLDLEILVSVEGLQIKRQKSILPRQKISVQLVTYAFID